MMAGTAAGSHSRDLELTDLLDGIAAGTVVLPNFQRDFDWNEPDVVSLLATVLRGWPAGSLLIMDGRPTFFDVREFEDAPPKAAAVQRVVLDGQQRLTSLYHAFRGAGPKVYALKVDKALVQEPTAEQLEDSILVLTRDQFESAKYQAQVATGRLVPLSVAASAPDYYEWRDSIVVDAPVEVREDVSYRLMQVYKHVLSKANRYKFPAMVLDTDLEPSAIARIFERINKTGMRLSTFDLLVARSYTTDWNLRKEWQRAREELPYLQEFLGEDGLMVAQTMALFSVGDVRQPAVLNMSVETIQSLWERCVDAVHDACSFLVDAGVLDGSWLPYRTQLLPLAALAVDVSLEQHREVLLGWFWGSSFSLSYEVASSTVAAEDYQRLKKILAQSSAPMRYEVSRRVMRLATRKQQASIWRSHRCLLLHHGAKDLISEDVLLDQPVENLATVSIVPTGLQDAPHLLVLSQVLAEKPSVRSLRARPLWSRSPHDLSAAGLESQFLTTNVLTPFDFDWPSVVEERLGAIEGFLSQMYPDSIEFVE